MMPLFLADVGKEYHIQRLAGSKDVKKHLEDLGFCVGSTVSIVTSNNGNLILNVKDSRIAIDRSLASKIFV